MLAYIPAPSSTMDPMGYPHGDCWLATAPASGAPAPACARLGWAAARSRWRATAVVRGVARPRLWRPDAPGARHQGVGLGDLRFGTGNHGKSWGKWWKNGETW